MASHISFVNAADAVTLSVFGDGYDETPIECMQTRQRDDRYVRAGLSTIDEVVIQADAGADPFQMGWATMFALLGVGASADIHGVRRNVPVTVQVWGFINVYDPGPSWVSESISLGDAGEYDLFGNSIPFVLTPTVDLSGPPMARYEFHVQIGRGESGTGRLEIARAWIGSALTLIEGIEESFTLKVIDRGSLDASKSEQCFESRGVRIRVMECSALNLSSVDVYGFDEAAGDGVWPSRPDAMMPRCVQGAQLIAGSTGEVLFVPRDGDSRMIRSMAICGHFSRIPDIRGSAGPCYATTFEVTEER